MMMFYFRFAFNWSYLNKSNAEMTAETTRTEETSLVVYVTLSCKRDG